MKNVIKTIFLFVFITFVPVSSTFADDTEVLEQQLNKLGVSEEYSNNIAQYITSMNITDEEYNSIIEDGDSVITMVQGKSSLTDFTLSELYSVYGDIRSIMRQLNLTMKIDIKNRQFAIVDKGTGDVLYKGNPKDIDEYYANYEELLDKGEDALNLEEYIKDLIDSRNSTYNEKTIVNEYAERSSFQNNNSIVKPTIEVKEIGIDETKVIAYEKPGVKVEEDVHEDDIVNPIEDDVENNEDKFYEVNSIENQEALILTTSKEISDETVYYILGGALIVLAVTSGYLKFL